MPLFETAAATQAYRKTCEDIVDVISLDDRTIIIVADGAGGTGDGRSAAETVIREVRNTYQSISTARQWESALAQIDQRISLGESTAVIVDLRPDRIIGASVGDSAAWVIDGDNIADLTTKQNRKPLLGSRMARPVGFEYPALDGILLAATDGFSNYVKREQVPITIAQNEFYSLPRMLMKLVQLPSGAWWDDIGIVVCRTQPRTQTRQQYEI